MALKKDKEYKGFIVSYWMIDVRNFVKKKNKTFFTILGYKNKATRNANINDYLPQMEQFLELKGEKTTADGYIAFKNTAFFEDATDELDK